ncbi:L-fucose mutarotase [Superficieibacter electus]|uniref:L-fucose mutarotase n=1 Tax=Superficieibacter electus TaxID=2022662 RepID=A0A2P5GSH2_9ENTR|nr:L-fucose mutarotase [Superficieibacter electus]POP46767.1 L-fucose mutarotase [Superficieibacter electus]POP49505.1 L-fucose mutarotase [Superficieibacter electus]
MLKNISPLLSPTLLKTLAEMGHGDEILLADAHFPAHSLGARVIRADGLSVSQLLGAMMPLIDLDDRVEPLVMMAFDAGWVDEGHVQLRYSEVLYPFCDEVRITRIDREAFYARARQAYAIVLTGETAAYGNLILRKGVTL